jgi:hypothetical protein
MLTATTANAIDICFLEIRLLIGVPPFLLFLDLVRKTLRAELWFRYQLATTFRTLIARLAVAAGEPKEWWI